MSRQGIICLEWFLGFRLGRCVTDAPSEQLCKSKNPVDIALRVSVRRLKSSLNLNRHAVDLELRAESSMLTATTREK